MDNDNDDDDKSVKSNVPFPRDWEADRDNMVRSYKAPLQDKGQDKENKTHHDNKDDYSVAAASAKTEVRSNKKLPPPTEKPPPTEIETTLSGVGVHSPHDHNQDYIALGANETIQEESEEEPDSPESVQGRVFDNKEVTKNKGPSLMDEDSNEDDNSDDVNLNLIRKDEASVSSGKQEVIAPIAPIAPPRNSLLNWVDCGTSQGSMSVKSRNSGTSSNKNSYPTVPKSPIPSSPKSTASKSRSQNQPQPRSTEDTGYAQFPAYQGKSAAGHMEVDSRPGGSEVDRSRDISADGDDDDSNDINGSYDEDEFGENHDSFDFSNTDSKELDASDDGFKVVKSIDQATARSMSSKDNNSPLEAKIGNEKAKAKGHSKTHAYSPSSGGSRKRSTKVPRSPSSPEDDKTAFSVATANSMSSKAKDWLKRVEMQKQKSALSKNNSRSKPQVEEPSASALFVSANDDTSTFEYGNKRLEQDGENDTVFDFGESPRSKSKNYVRKQSETAAPAFKQQARQRQRQQENQGQHQEGLERNLNNAHMNDSMSEITAPSEVSSFTSKRRPQVQSFLSRLQACTSPAFDDQDGSSNGNSNMPSAHLAFLKKSAQDTANCAPAAAAAGGQGIIDMLQAQTLCGTTGAGADGASTASGLPPLAPSAAASGANKGKGSIASSYLQAIKERSTGSGSGKSSGGVERTPSVASTTSSKSETWQKFLEKRNKALESTSRRSLTSSQSKAAEKYAAQKLEEIMKEVSAVPNNGNNDDDDSKRSKSTTKLRPPSSTAGMLPRSKSTGRPQLDGRLSRKSALSRNEAAKAAQDLAAARVEAMMAMTSSTRLEEGEI